MTVFELERPSCEEDLCAVLAIDEMTMVQLLSVAKDGSKEHGRDWRNKLCYAVAAAAGKTSSSRYLLVAVVDP